MRTTLRDGAGTDGGLTGCFITWPERITGRPGGDHGLTNGIGKRRDSNPAAIPDFPWNDGFETFGSGGRFAAETLTVKLPRFGLQIEAPQNRAVLEGAGLAMIRNCRGTDAGCAPCRS